MDDFSMEDLNEINQELEKQNRETLETIERLKAEKREIEKKIKMLKDPKSRIFSKARFSKDEEKEKWQIAVVGSYYTHRREKGEPWYVIEKRPYSERMERWIPIIQALTEDEAKKELKEIIKALQKLDREINK